MPDASARAFGRLTAEVETERATMGKPARLAETLPPRILQVLASAAGPLSAGRIGQELRVSTPTMAAVLKGMAAAGQVMAGHTERGQTRYSLPLAALGQADN